MAEMDNLINAAVNEVAGNISPKSKAALIKAVTHMVLHGGTLAEAMGFTEDNLEWMYAQAYGRYKSGRFEEAMRIFKYLLRLDYTKTKYYLGLGACHYMLKNYNLAVFPYASAMTIDPTNPIPIYYVAECFIKLGDKEAALRAYDKMLDLFERVPFYQKLQTRIELTANSLRKELGAPPRKAKERAPVPAS